MCTCTQVWSYSACFISNNKYHLYCKCCQLNIFFLVFHARVGQPPHASSDLSLILAKDFFIRFLLVSIKILISWNDWASKLIARFERPEQAGV